MVHHGGSRLHIVCLFLFPVLFSGPLSNGLDKAGDGDLHRAQQGQQSAQAEEQIRNHIAAGPADQHGKAAAEDAAGGPRSAAGIQVCNDADSLCHALGLNGQMVNAAAEEYNADHAHTAHNRLLLPPEGLNQENRRQSGNGKIESHLTQQPQNHGFERFQQCSIRIDGNDEKQHKQAYAQYRRQDVGRQTSREILIALFHLFRIFLFGWGRFAAGSPGGISFLRTGGLHFRLRGLLLCHEYPPNHKNLERYLKARASRLESLALMLPGSRRM